MANRTGTASKGALTVLNLLEVTEWALQQFLRRPDRPDLLEGAEEILREATERKHRLDEFVRGAESEASTGAKKLASRAKSEFVAFFPADEVQELLNEQHGSVALMFPIPDKPWMHRSCPEAFFVGAFNHLGAQDKHAHSLAEELYINMGPSQLRVNTWPLGTYKPYDLDTGSCVCIPRGVVHLAEFHGPGWGVCVCGPHIFGDARKQIVG